MAHPQPGQTPPPKRWTRSRRRWVAVVVVGVSIVAFVTTPFGAAVHHVSRQLARVMSVAEPDAVRALPPPATGSSHGAAGSALNGLGGSIAPSATSASWPGTGAGANGGPFAFVGAHHGPLWAVPSGPNNSVGVGYCVMEDVGGSGSVSPQPDPPLWEAGEMARAAALMSTFGGDRVVPYGIDSSGAYDVAAGEWEHPRLLGGGEFVRRRHIAVNFGVRMFLQDVSPRGVAAGRRLARDTAVVDGAGGDFAALRNGYEVARYMADVADVQAAVGGIALSMHWKTPTGLPPDVPGTYPLEVRVADSAGRAVGMVPVLLLSDVGMGTHRTVGAVARVDNSVDSVDDLARWNAATATGWPSWDMADTFMTDRRFAVGDTGADVADRSGVARFDVTISSAHWELGFHAEAPTDDVVLHSGTGIQGQATWAGPPRSASVHDRFVPAAAARFHIRKALDDAGVQGSRDMSGFLFAVTRTADGAALGTFTTDAAGRTPVIESVVGDVHVAEVGRPAWAAALIDTGPITFHLAPPSAPDGEAVEFTYTNLIPPATISTSASDANDGDRFVDLARSGATPPGGTVVDRVDYCGLLPGSSYASIGTIQTMVGDRPTPSGVEGLAAFTPTDGCGTVEVRLDIPAGSALLGQVGVVFQTVVLVGTGQVVAQHHDPADPAQTIHFPNVSTMLSGVRRDGDDRTIEVGDEVTDVVTFAGLAPGHDYRAELTLHEKLADGTCVATAAQVSQDFHVDAGTGTVNVGGVTVTEPGLFVGFQRISLIDEASPGGDSVFTLVAAHEDCDESSQTVRSIAPPPPPPPPPSPPPTPAPTATPPEATEPTTSPAPVTTPSTNPPGQPSTASTTPTTIASRPPLPRTGSDARRLALTAALLATCGAGALVCSRRRW